jgi:lipopolysaccharide/colanic/teichoic acid biosynthesis glycosyltransferase
VEGCVDAVEDGVTGLLVRPRDSEELYEALQAYAGSQEMRAAHGMAGRERALRDFRPEAIWRLLLSEYTCLLASRRSPSPLYKRMLDVFGAAAGLILLAPLIGLIAVTVGAVLGRPILFVQRRPGWGGRPFSMYKFRTMLEKYDSHGKPLSDERRLTGLGRFLRKASLDELPELWNVLKGDMSLVGPRPLLMEYVPLYSPRQAKRHRVRPGMTGWAQVNGRNNTSWDRRLELDSWYVDHQSFLLDLRILARTVKQVLTMEGIHQEGNATMEKFPGSPTG